jgi:hypothetical protein
MVAKITFSFEFNATKGAKGRKGERAKGERRKGRIIVRIANHIKITVQTKGQKRD